MSDQRRTERELVYCHACENEWHRDEHGLECPECHSDAVEIVSGAGRIPEPWETFDFKDAWLTPNQIEPDSDPRREHDLEYNHPDTPDGDRWNEDAPDPDEGNIDHVEWEGPGGMHFSRTTYHSGNTMPRSGPAQPAMGDLFGGLLGALMGPSPGLPGARNIPGSPGSPHPGSPRIRGQIGFAATSSANGTRTGTIHFGDPNRPGGDPRAAPFTDLAGIFGNVLHGMHGHVVVGGPGMPDMPPPNGTGDPGGRPTMAPNPFAALAAMLNPANARAGDAVFTQEALDRVISNLMEQHGGSTAPGPASEAAIAALPKIRIAKEHLDAQGKAECSICMDALSVGDEVTELPCKHWFHGDCVAAWLREHDTCPQCRRGITPRDGDANTPRATGEAPRFWQMQEQDFEVLRSPTSPTGGGLPGSSGSPFSQFPPQPSGSAPGPNGSPRRGSRPGPSGGTFSHSPPRPSSGPAASQGSPPRQNRSGPLGGIANWMGRRFSGGSHGSDNGGQQGGGHG